jgi:hypothetical protein
MLRDEYPADSVGTGRPKPSDGSCRNCGERPGTEKYSASGGALDFIHGSYQMWCRVCVLEAQLSHARERAAAIPDLERQLQEARDAL